MRFILKLPPQYDNMNDNENADAVIQFHSSMEKTDRTNVSLAEFLETVAHTTTLLYAYRGKYMRHKFVSPNIVISALY